MGTPETSREPCPDRILDDVGGAFGMGAVGGSAFHFIKGLYNSPNGERLAGGTQDSWNSIIAGATTGGFLQMHQGTEVRPSPLPSTAAAPLLDPAQPCPPPSVLRPGQRHMDNALDRVPGDPDPDLHVGLLAGCGPQNSDGHHGEGQVPGDVERPHRPQPPTLLFHPPHLLPLLASSSQPPRCSSTSPAPRTPPPMTAPPPSSSSPVRSSATPSLSSPRESTPPLSLMPSTTSLSAPSTASSPASPTSDTSRSSAALVTGTTGRISPFLFETPPSIYHHRHGHNRLPSKPSPVGSATDDPDEEEEEPRKASALSFPFSPPPISSTDGAASASSNTNLFDSFP